MLCLQHIEILLTFQAAAASALKKAHAQHTNRNDAEESESDKDFGSPSPMKPNASVTVAEPAPNAIAPVAEPEETGGDTNTHTTTHTPTQHVLSYLPLIGGDMTAATLPTNSMSEVIQHIKQHTTGTGLQTGVVAHSEVLRAEDEQVPFCYTY